MSLRLGHWSVTAIPAAPISMRRPPSATGQNRVSRETPGPSVKITGDLASERTVMPSRMRPVMPFASIEGVRGENVAVSVPASPGRIKPRRNLVLVHFGPACLEILTALTGRTWS